MATLKLPPGTTITYPDGRQITTGEPGELPAQDQPVTKATVAKMIAADPAIQASHAAAGAAVMKAEATRQEVIKALEDAADRWTAKALAEASSTSELRQYLMGKSRSAREQAARLRRGEDVK